MVYNKADFKKHIETIQIGGFKLKSAVQAYLFVCKHKDKTETITISYRNYAPHGFYIDGVSVDIYFNEVENILHRFKKEYFPDKHYGNTTIQKVYIKFEDVDYSKFEIEIKDDFTFGKVASEIRKIINNGALPFFAMFSELKTVFEETEKMPIDEMAKFITQPLPQRRIVIKWLCKDIKYQDYVDMVIDYYKSEHDNTWKEIELLDSYLKTMVQST